MKELFRLLVSRKDLPVDEINTIAKTLIDAIHIGKLDIGEDYILTVSNTDDHEKMDTVLWKKIETHEGKKLQYDLRYSKEQILNVLHEDYVKQMEPKGRKL